MNKPVVVGPAAVVDKICKHAYGQPNEWPDVPYNST